MIEWRFGLPPLSVRDRTANNLAEVLNLAAPNVTAPAFSVPMGPFGRPCPPATPAANNAEAARRAANLQRLKTMSLKAGFKGVR
jgi:phospholipase C